MGPCCDRLSATRWCRAANLLDAMGILWLKWQFYWPENRSKCSMFVCEIGEVVLFSGMASHANSRIGRTAGWVYLKKKKKNEWRVDDAPKKLFGFESF